MNIGPGDHVLIPLVDLDTPDDTLVALGERLNKRFPSVTFTFLTGCAMAEALVYHDPQSRP